VKRNDYCSVIWHLLSSWNASYRLQGRSEEEAKSGKGKIESKNLHGFRSSELDGDLRRASAQFRAEPAFGDDRASRRSCGSPSRAVAIHAVRPDGAGYTVPALHALSVGETDRHCGDQGRLYLILIPAH
jgi:hypothetical protein